MSDRLQPGTLVAGRFKLIKPLGQGGGGEVYLAEQLSMGREVALKLLSIKDQKDPRVVERFRREAKQTCQLSHTNTVVCFDFGDDMQKGLLFLVMEYLPGRTLDDVLRAEGPLAPMRVLEIIEQIAGSLDEAHGRGMIHRDLKPSNIILTDRGAEGSKVKVIDFGIAKIFDKKQGVDKRQSLTAAGLVMGTPQYMAPEQVRQQPLDTKTDVYALGILAFEMLTGKPPFDALHHVEIMRCHLQDDPPLLQDIVPTLDLPMGLNAVLQRALAKKPELRHRSVMGFAAAFAQALEGKGRATTKLKAFQPLTPPPTEDVESVSDDPTERSLVITSLDEEEPSTERSAAILMLPEVTGQETEVMTSNDVMKAIARGKNPEAVAAETERDLKHDPNASWLDDPRAGANLAEEGELSHKGLWLGLAVLLVLVGLSALWAFL